MKRQISLTNLSLNQFQVGQPLMVKFSIGRGYYVHCPAEFVSIERGMVQAKLFDGWGPEWYDSYRLEQKYPTRIGLFRAKNCYVWGKGTTDTWERCYWFIDTKTPVT